MEYLVLMLLAYLLGSIPTALIAGKVTKGIDLRAHGSGNVGATNALRTLGVGAFVLVFTVDFIKGFLPVTLASLLIGTTPAQMLTGLAALLGHNWSLYIGFSGGRGVATGIGTLYAISPVVSAAVTVVTVTVILISRYVSLGSIIGGIAVLLIMLAAVLLGLERPDYLLYVIPGALIVIYRHRDNLDRLLRGTERKLGESALPQN